MEPASTAIRWHPRLARLEETDALEALITLSVETLQAHCYTPEQRRACMGPVYGVDRQLIVDGTYYVVEAPGEPGALIACGGWSMRQSLFGGSAGRVEPPPLVPGRDPARVRAFFVHPDWTRRGVAQAILVACEDALTAAGFTEVVLSATLPGIPFYAKFGYQEYERYEIPLDGAPGLAVAGMRKRF